MTTTGTYERNELRLAALSTLDPETRRKFRLGRLLEVQRGIEDGSNDDVVGGEPPRFTLNFGTSADEDMPVLSERASPVASADKELEAVLNGEGMRLLAHPALRALGVTGVDATGVFRNDVPGFRALLKRPELAYVTWLSTPGAPLKAAASAVEKSPHLGGLRHWDLSGTGLKAASLAAAKSLQNLESLDVGGNGLDEKDFLALVTGASFAKLRVLRFAGNKLGAGFKDVWKRAELARLTSLALDSTGWKDWAPLAASPHIGELRHLSVHNGVGTNLEPVWTSTNLPRLRSLSIVLQGKVGPLALPALEELRLNTMSPEVLISLAESPMSARLRSLDLSLWSKAAFQALPVVLASPHLKNLTSFTLYVHEGAGTPEARLELVKALAFPRLRELRLNLPAFELASLEALLRALGEAPLEVLKFSAASEEGWRLMGETPALAGLKRVHVGGDEKGLIALARSRYLRSLETLILRGTLHEEGVSALLESPNFARLVEVDMKIDETLPAALEARLAAHANLPKLWIAPPFAKAFADDPEVRTRTELGMMPF